MSMELTEIEQDFLNLSDTRGLTSLQVNSSVSLLANQVQRSGQADNVLPNSMAIRAGLVADALEKVEKAQVLLAGLSQKLIALQQEQLKNL